MERGLAAAPGAVRGQYSSDLAGDLCGWSSVSQSFRGTSDRRRYRPCPGTGGHEGGTSTASTSSSATRKPFRSRWAIGFRIESNRQKAETLGGPARGLQAQPPGLSLFALFVGIFLIYNTAMFAVVSRRRDAGILLALGASADRSQRPFSSKSCSSARRAAPSAGSSVTC